MSIKINSSSLFGIEANRVEIEIAREINKARGFHVLGFSENQIRQSRERIFKALEYNGYDIEAAKWTINFYPALHKLFLNTYDLPITIGILQSLKHIELSKSFINETFILGELSLDGKIRPIKGILPIAYNAKKFKIKRLIIPNDNISEALMIKDIEIIGVSNIDELIRYLKKEIQLKSYPFSIKENKNHYDVDFSDIKGHEQAKRALQIAAAGHHNILMVGSPGSGKTMLAKRLPTIMPEMNNDEIIETSKIYSISSKTSNYHLITTRPFREPHHTASSMGLIGGGSNSEPGEISLAHNGILFMDEFTEFRRTVIEALRQPLESNTITISRANQNLTYPASFILVAALNPCPCGYSGDSRNKCNCSFPMIMNYMQKISGPILDRIDIQLIVNPVNINIISGMQLSKSSVQMKLEVDDAANIQMKRQKKYNGLISVKEIDKYCIMETEAKSILKIAYEKLRLSSRSFHKVIKIARTIADLESSEVISKDHIKEALMYRSIDKMIRE